MDAPLEVIRDALRRELASMPPLPPDAAHRIAARVHAGIEEAIRLRAEAALYDFLDTVPPFTDEQITRIAYAMRGGAR
ncbi:hypothetical protein [uncultured Microbacterium sp.]|uniref:hypothetical protein n=1 Tax=uncultured Microbacterium sp. TaxID=191216 RepID=UPI0028D1A1D6|nr:hypothetical protein [uncultured Microbacterium sp.]